MKIESCLETGINPEPYRIIGEGKDRYLVQSVDSCKAFLIVEDNQWTNASSIISITSESLQLIAEAMFELIEECKELNEKFSNMGLEE